MFLYVCKSYAALLEVGCSELVGSDIVKRFLKKFLGYAWIIWRPILHELFIWRVKQKQSDVIELYIDTMIPDNDNALKREGVQIILKTEKPVEYLFVNGCESGLSCRFIDQATNLNCVISPPTPGLRSDFLLRRSR